MLFRSWLQKNGKFRAGERADAEGAYNHARAVYRRLLQEGIDK